jgi:hypothetical protein
MVKLKIQSRETVEFSKLIRRVDNESVEDQSEYGDDSSWRDN